MLKCIRDFGEWELNMPISFNKTYYSGIGIDSEYNLVRLEQELALYSSEYITPICYINGEGITVYINTRDVVLEYNNGNELPRTKIISTKRINRDLHYTFDDSPEGERCKLIVRGALKARLNGTLKPFRLCKSQEEASKNFKRYCKQVEKVLDVLMCEAHEGAKRPMGAAATHPDLLL